MSAAASNVLLERYFFAPVGAGSFAAGSPSVAEGRAGSRKRGVAVQLQCQLQGQKIKAARFLAWGCPHSIAAASWLTEKLTGLSLDEASGVGAMQIAAALKVPADRLGSILVLEDALVACLENARSRCHVW